MDEWTIKKATHNRSPFIKYYRPRPKVDFEPDSY